MILPSTSSKNKIHPFPIAEYLLLLQPHEALSNQIRDIKKQFATDYDMPAAVQSKPHITLVNFVQYINVEERIRQQFRSISLHLAPFLIELLDYGSFPSHTIYINIATRSPIETLVKNIRANTQALLKLNNDNKPHFIMNPHISIAHKLKPWQYEKAWLKYANSFFTGKFIAQDMIMLRKIEGDQKYTLVERFEFQDIPVPMSQTVLF